jgi:GAF domain-containing protein
MLIKFSVTYSSTFFFFIFFPYQDARFNQAMDKKTGFRTRSILCMAIRNHKGEVVGVVQALNKEPSGTFTEEDEKLCSAFTAQAAVAISNSNLFQSTERALNQVGELTAI